MDQWPKESLNKTFALRPIVSKWNKHTTSDLIFDGFSNNEIYLMKHFLILETYLILTTYTGMSQNVKSFKSENENGFSFSKKRKTQKFCVLISLSKSRVKLKCLVILT